MSRTILAEQVSGSAIPVPKRPTNDDVNPADFKPIGLSDKEMAELKDAAFEAASALVGASFLPQYKMAGQNMTHYLTGTGLDRAPATPEQIETESPAFDAANDGVLAKFIEAIVADMKASKLMQQAYILLYPASKANPKNWVGFRFERSQTPELHYALGEAAYSYGALTADKGTYYEIEYKLYIWDRYNWNPKAGVTVPTYTTALVSNFEPLDRHGYGAILGDEVLYEDKTFGMLANDVSNGQTKQTKPAANYDIWMETKGAHKIQVAK